MGGFVKTPLFRDVDTCGIHNLHGMPGILGGMFSIVAPLMYTDTMMDAFHQASGLVGTLAVAVLTGAGTGYLLNAIGSSEQITQETKVVVCEPDEIGLKANWDSGLITSIEPGGHADRLGVKIGWTLFGL